MRCIICDSTDKWENVDAYRYKKEGMAICNGCGFISYPDKTKEKLIVHYRGKGYRPPPTAINLYQGQRKIHYHQEFLMEPVLKKWKDSGKKDPCVFEVGAAMGMVLAWLKNIRSPEGLFFPEIDVNGSELTLSYRRNAYHEYGIALQEDFDDSKKYDLIMSYKVAEHMLDVDKELIRYKKALKEDGFLYISVPTWFNRLHNFGSNGFAIEYYYAPEHVNVWSRMHFEWLLESKCGFKIVKRNYSYYDDTYLCIAASENEPVRSIESLPKPSLVKEWLGRIKKADELMQKKYFLEALEQWPNFPITRTAVYEYKKKEHHDKGGLKYIMKEVIEPWIKIDPDSYDVYSLAADIHMRYNAYKEALKYLEKCLYLRPRDVRALMDLSSCFRSLAKASLDPKEKVYFTMESRKALLFLKDSHLELMGQALTGIYSDNAEIPCLFELGEVKGGDDPKCTG